LIQQIVRQLNSIVQDDKCVQLIDLYHNEEALNNSTGGPLVSQSRRSNQEASYQRKAEHLTAGDNTDCFKIIVSQKQKQIHVGFELLDTDDEREADHQEFARWCDYLEHYISNTEDTSATTDEMKEKMQEKPVFLQRNANYLRRQRKMQDEDDLVVSNNLELKFPHGTYKITYIPGTEDLSYRLNKACNTRKSQAVINQRLHGKFHSWLEKWERENVSRDMARQTKDWLLGKVTGLMNQTTTMSTQKVGNLSKNIYQVKGCTNTNKQKQT